MDIVQSDFKKILRRKVSGLKEVTSPEQCQAILFFCPIISRAGTDIDAAMDHLKRVKASTPVIMVILHPTFELEKIISDSNNAIKRENTFAVDCLFYETVLHTCQKNEEAIDKTAKFFKSKNLTSYCCLNNHGNPNLSTDQDAENCPLVGDGGSGLNSRQDDTCCLCCIRRICCCCPFCACRTFFAFLRRGFRHVYRHCCGAN